MRRVMSRPPRTVSVLALSLVAAACSSKHTDTATVAPTPGIQIDQANATHLALLAVRSVFGFIDGVAAGSNLQFAVPPAPPTPTNPAPVFTSPVVVTEFGPEGGDAFRSWEDVDGDEHLSPGDTVLSVLHAYGEGGRTYDGIVMVEVEAITGVPPLVDAGEARGRLTMVNLGIGTSNGTTVFNGSMRFRRERRTTVDLLQVELDGALEVDGATLLAGTRITRDSYPLIERLALAADGALLVEGSPGELVFENGGVFAAFNFLPQPYTGGMKLFGSGGSTIEIVATETFALRIDSDLDADGDVDETTTTTWPL